MKTVFMKISGEDYAAADFEERHQSQQEKVDYYNENLVGVEEHVVDADDHYWEATVHVHDGTITEEQFNELDMFFDHDSDHIKNTRVYWIGFMEDTGEPGA